jgi:hypothetical protein
MLLPDHSLFAKMRLASAGFAAQGYGFFAAIQFSFFHDSFTSVRRRRPCLPGAEMFAN